MSVKRKDGGARTKLFKKIGPIASYLSNTPEGLKKAIGESALYGASAKDRIASLTECRDLTIAANIALATALEAKVRELREKSKI